MTASVDDAVDNDAQNDVGRRGGDDQRPASRKPPISRVAAFAKRAAAAEAAAEAAAAAAPKPVDWPLERRRRKAAK